MFAAPLRIQIEDPETAQPFLERRALNEFAIQAQWCAKQIL
jgi:hypothetical protein